MILVRKRRILYPWLLALLIATLSWTKNHAWGFFELTHTIPGQIEAAISENIGENLDAQIRDKSHNGDGQKGSVQ